MTTERNIEPTDYLTLAAAAHHVPGRPHVSTLWRWCRRGIVARSGERIRLAHMRLGSRVLTTRAALAAFGEAMARADQAYFEQNAGGTTPDPVSARRNAAEQAARDLDAEGI